MCAPRDPRASTLTSLFMQRSKENPGSLWPKVTLGVVRDGARLTPVQYAALCRVCEQATAAMVGEAGGRGYLVRCVGK